MSECQVCDNTVTVVWTLPEPDTKTDHYILEHRRTNHEGPPRAREEYPWMVVEGIRQTEHTLTGDPMAFKCSSSRLRTRRMNSAGGHIYNQPTQQRPAPYLVTKFCNAKRSPSENHRRLDKTATMLMTKAILKFLVPAMKWPFYILLQRSRSPMWSIWRRKRGRKCPRVGKWIFYYSCISE